MTTFWIWALGNLVVGAVAMRLGSMLVQIEREMYVHDESSCVRLWFPIRSRRVRRRIGAVDGCYFNKLLAREHYVASVLVSAETIRLRQGSHDQHKCRGCSGMIAAAVTGFWQLGSMAGSGN